MDALNDEAFTSLTAALEALLPPAAEPALEPRLTLNPRRVRGSGLGGFIGQSHDPDGELVGRFVEASAHVSVRAESADTLDAAVGKVTRALVGTGRADLRQTGILRLELDALGARTPQAQGGNTPASQDVTFDVAYEFVKHPQEGGGVIAEVPLELDLTGERQPRLLLRTEFEDGSLDAFEVVDDPLATTNAPSQWAYSAAERRVEQRSAISGGTAAVNANKPGTYLVLRTTPSRPAAADVLLTAHLASGDVQGVGLVYRFLDPDNFCFFVMNRDKGYRLLAKKVAGSFSQLATPALDAAKGFELDHVYRVRLVARGPDVQVFLDGRLALQGRDPSVVAPGRVGFMSFRNPQARFHDLELTEV